MLEALPLIGLVIIALVIVGLWASHIRRVEELRLKSTSRMIEAEVLLELMHSSVPLSVQTLSERMGLYGSRSIQTCCTALQRQGRIEAVTAQSTNNTGESILETHYKICQFLGARHVA